MCCLLPEFHTILVYTHKCSFFYAHEKSMYFHASICTKLINDQQHFSQISFTEFHSKYGKHKYKFVYNSKQRVPFAVPIFTKLKSLSTFFLLFCAEYFPDWVKIRNSLYLSRVKFDFHDADFQEKVIQRNCMYSSAPCFTKIAKRERKCSHCDHVLISLSTEMLP